MDRQPGAETTAGHAPGPWVLARCHERQGNIPTEIYEQQAVPVVARGDPQPLHIATVHARHYEDAGLAEAIANAALMAQAPDLQAEVARLTWLFDSANAELLRQDQQKTGLRERLGTVEGALRTLSDGIEPFNEHADACIFCGDTSGDNHADDCTLAEARAALEAKPPSEAKR